MPVGSSISIASAYAAPVEPVKRKSSGAPEDSPEAKRAHAEGGDDVGISGLSLEDEADTPAAARAAPTDVGPMEEEQIAPPPLHDHALFHRYGNMPTSLVLLTAEYAGLPGTHDHNAARDALQVRLGAADVQSADAMLTDGYRAQLNAGTLNLQNVPVDLRDPKWYGVAIGDGSISLSAVPEHLRTSEICLKAINRTPGCIGLVPKELPDYPQLEQLATSLRLERKREWTSEIPYGFAP